jgi:DNA-binding response OmpR family regulator
MMITTRSAVVPRLPVDDGIQPPAASAGTAEPGEPAPQESSSRVGTSAPKQILVVGEDPAARDWVARTVARAGFRADTASDGETGWNAFLNSAYDLVITDHKMPKLTGLELIVRIRSFSLEPPCIVISGNLPEVESILKQLVGPNAILAKPFSPAELIEKVYSHLLHGNITEA